MARVLVVDDEARMTKIVEEMLSRAGHEVSVAVGGELALRQLAENDFHVVVTDLKMPEVGGMDVLRAARARDPAPRVILVTAYGSIRSAVEALQAGAADYLVKPFSMEELRAKVHRLSEEVGETREGDADPFAALVGESAVWRRAVEEARRVAAYDATVLLVGETGTGKELMAQAIHAASPRSEKPLVIVNCAALPETLLESELFGHEKGSFTGATARRVGLAEAADGGTLFLDEVGELSAATQAKVLRFLQEKTFLRLGSTEVRQVDVRLVAATNRELKTMVAQGGFREDLFYRLAVFPVSLPPLRHRREDLPALVTALLGRGRSGAAAQPGPGFVERLLEHDWPGNVRELQNVLERATILAGSGPLLPDHLPPEVGSGASSVSGGDRLDAGARPPGAPGAAPLSLEQSERALIDEALRRTGGNKSAAARLLGITRRRLYSMLERLGGDEES